MEAELPVQTASISHNVKISEKHETAEESRVSSSERRVQERWNIRGEIHQPVSLLYKVVRSV